MTEIEKLMAQLAEAIRRDAQQKASEADDHYSIPVPKLPAKNMSRQVQLSKAKQIVLDHMRSRRMM